MKHKPTEILRLAFFGLIIRPFLLIILGFNVRHFDRLIIRTAHLIASNHNSHLDTLVLLSLFKLYDLPKVKVVAAKDYFCRTPFLNWFSMNIIGIIPIDREGGTKDPLAPIIAKLDEGYTVIIFPEGSRGDPEMRTRLKSGVARILEERQKVTITPIFIHGLGKALPRGDFVLVPFVCDINIGEQITWPGNRQTLISDLEKKFDNLAEEISPKSWQ